MIVVAGLLLLAALCWPWPDRSDFVPEAPVLPGGGTRSRHSTAPDPTGSTVNDVADAVALLAMALKGGAAVTTALDRVADLSTGQVSDDLRTVAAAHRWGLPSAVAWSQLDPCWRSVALVWEAAESAGVAPAALLESAAQRLREQEAAAREARLQRAGVLLVLPLGGLFLPGFLATTVVPVVLHLLGPMGR